MLARTAKRHFRKQLTATILAVFALPLLGQKPEEPASVPLLPSAEMTASDLRLVADHQSAIAESAQFYGYALDSSYDYKQIACPFAPGHLLLSYESAQSESTVSRFTAILRRDANASIASSQRRVEIIPVLHFGVVPFVQAYSNPHSIEVFNQAVTAAPTGREAVVDLNGGQQPLLLRSLCFMAMIGAPSSVQRNSAFNLATVQAPLPTVQFAQKGIVRQVFSVRNSEPSYQVWTLTFSRAGKLLTAQPEERNIRTESPVLRAATPAPVAPPQPSAPLQPAAQAPPLTSTTQAPPDSPTPPPARPAENPPAVASSPASSSPVPASSPASPSTTLASGPAAAFRPAASMALPAPSPAPAVRPASLVTATAPAPTTTSTLNAPVAPPRPEPEVQPQPVDASSIPPTNAPVLAPPAAANAPAPESKSSSVASVQAIPPPQVSQSAHRATMAASAAPSASSTVSRPSGRFIPDPPQPPHRIVLDSALPNPPHAP